MRQKPPFHKALAVAVLAVFLAWLGRRLLDPWFGDQLVFFTYFPALFAVAWWGGFRPAFMATLISVPFIGYLSATPTNWLAIDRPENQVALLLFVLIGLAIGWFGDQLHEARGKLQHAHDRANAEQERLRVTLASIGDAVVVTDEFSRIVSLNSLAESLTGWPEQEAVGKHLEQVLHIVDEETRERMEDPSARVLRSGRITGLATQTLLISKEGVERPIDDSAAPIVDTQGTIRGVVVVFRDMSSRRHSDHALAFLARSSRELAALVDRESALQQSARLAVPYLADWCVVYVVDEHGEIEHHAHAHYEPDKEPLLTKMLTDSPLDWSSATATVIALRTGQSQLMADLPQEFLDSVAQSESHRDALRVLHPKAVIAVPLKIRERTIGVIGLVSCDVHRRYTENELRLAERFAEQVATAVDNARLFHAVSQAVRQKDEFLAMLAHELRNPLAAIRYAVSLGQLGDDTPFGELLDIMDRQTQNLSQLVDDLLDVSRISRDKVALRRRHIEVATVVDRAASTVRTLLEQKRHEFVLEIAEESMLLHADPTRAEQIFANLLTNAAKYTQKGGRVTVRAQRLGSDAVIEVIDTGIGLPPEMLTRVFDLFAQADRTLDRSEGGLGIGLTVARKLTEMHGGTLSAASEGLGKGATFTVRLPLTPLPATGNESAPTTWQPTDQSKLRILVVDDNHDTAYGCAMLLRAMGHEVETAFDGITALERAREFKPEAMFLDIGLPGMNGYDVARTLRKEGFDHELIVAISGYGQPDDQRRSREAGFNQHLVKPLDQAVIVEALRSIDGKQVVASS